MIQLIAWIVGGAIALVIAVIEVPTRLFIRYCVPQIKVWFKKIHDHHNPWNKSKDISSITEVTIER